MGSSRLLYYCRGTVAAVDDMEGTSPLPDGAMHSLSPDVFTHAHNPPNGVRVWGARRRRLVLQFPLKSLTAEVAVPDAAKLRPKLMQLEVTHLLDKSTNYDDTVEGAVKVSSVVHTSTAPTAGTTFAIGRVSQGGGRRHPGCERRSCGFRAMDSRCTVGCVSVSRASAVGACRCWQPGCSRP